MAPHSSTLAWKIPWTKEPGGLQSMGSLRVRHNWATSLSLSTFHFHALEKEMTTHSSVLAWRIPGMGEPVGLPSMGSHRVEHDCSGLAEVYIHIYIYTHIHTYIYIYTHTHTCVWVCVAHVCIQEKTVRTSGHGRCEIALPHKGGETPEEGTWQLHHTTTAPMGYHFRFWYSNFGICTAVGFWDCFIFLHEKRLSILLKP